jgi:competence protein ComEA
VRRRDRELAARRLAAVTATHPPHEPPVAARGPAEPTAPGPSDAVPPWATAEEPRAGRAGRAPAAHARPRGRRGDARTDRPVPGAAAAPPVPSGAVAGTPDATRDAVRDAAAGWVPTRADGGPRGTEQPHAPLDPAPLDPAPLDPAPLDPAPMDPAPLDPAPLDPAPLDPGPPTRTLDALRSAAQLRSDTPAADPAGAGVAWLPDEPPAGGARARLRWSVEPRTAAVAAIAILLVGGAVALHAARGAPGEPVALPTPGQASSAPVVVGEVVVDVVGEVTGPGVVRLPTGSRVVDAVAAAGGATSRAELAALNLARVLVDGEQIVVPRRGAPAAAAPTAGTSGDGLVDVNTADAATLDALPGIGPVLAQRILDERAKHPFSTVDELADVPGIGPSLLARLRALVRT